MFKKEGWDGKASLIASHRNQLESQAHLRAVSAPPGGGAERREISSLKSQQGLQMIPSDVLKSSDWILGKRGNKVFCKRGHDHFNIFKQYTLSAMENPKIAF